MAVGNASTAHVYTVTIRFPVVTKRDRRQIAEAALVIVKESMNVHGSYWRSGELVEITQVEGKQENRLRR